MKEGRFELRAYGVIVCVHEEEEKEVRANTWWENSEDGPIYVIECPECKQSVAN